MIGLDKFIQESGATLFGYADISMLPEDARKGLPRGISIGVALAPEIVGRIPSGPHLEYVEAYDNLNARLDEICLKVCDYLVQRGYQAVPQTTTYVSAQRKNNEKGYAAIPHKTVAALSGLGWITKSSLLVTKSYGSAVRITSLLTDAPMATKPVTYACLCGDCRICVDACPGHAIKNMTWNVHADRDELIDYSACRDTVHSRGMELEQDHATCGICLAVCPYTQNYVKYGIIYSTECCKKKPSV